MSTDLVEWLRAQLDEDERLARATVWGGSGNRLSWELIASATIDVGSDEFYVGDRTIANHMMAWQPARVLREIDAKRQLLTIHRPYVAEPGQACLGCAGGTEFEGCPVVRLLALPYADRPGYLEEWRP